MRLRDHVSPPAISISSVRNAVKALAESSTSRRRSQNMLTPASTSNTTREANSERGGYATRSRVTQDTRRSTPESEDVDMTEDEDDELRDDMSHHEPSASPRSSTPSHEETTQRDKDHGEQAPLPRDTATSTTTTTVEPQPQASTSTLPSSSTSTPSSPPNIPTGSHTSSRPPPTNNPNHAQLEYYPAYDMHGGRIGLQATLHGKEPEKKGSYYRLRTHFYPASMDDVPHVMSFDLNGWNSEPPESEPPSPPPPVPSGSSTGGNTAVFRPPVHQSSSSNNNIQAPTPRPTGRPPMGPDPNFRGEGSRATTPEIRYILGMRPDDPVSLSTLRDPAPGQKPNYPYPTLITLAIHESTRKSLTLQEIYQALEARFEWYREHPDDKSWHNSIRHNLSLNKRFRRVTRNLIEGGKGCRWVVDLSGGEGNKRPRKRNKRKAVVAEPNTTTSENASNDASPAPFLEDPVEDIETDFPRSPGLGQPGAARTPPGTHSSLTLPTPPAAALNPPRHHTAQTGQGQQIRRDGDVNGEQSRTVIGSSHWTPYYPYAYTASMAMAQEPTAPRRPYDTEEYDRPFVPDPSPPTRDSPPVAEDSRRARPAQTDINPTYQARHHNKRRPTLQPQYDFDSTVHEPSPAPPSPPPPPATATHSHVCPTCGTTTPGRLWPVSSSSTYHNATTPIEPIPTSTYQPNAYSSNPSPAPPPPRPSVPTQQITLSHTTRPIPPPPPLPPTLSYSQHLQPLVGHTSGDAFPSTSHSVPSSSHPERGRRPRDVYTDSRGNVYPKRGRNMDYSSDSSDD